MTLTLRIYCKVILLMKTWGGGGEGSNSQIKVIEYFASQEMLNLCNFWTKFSSISYPNTEFRLLPSFPKTKLFAGVMFNNSSLK